MTEGVDVVATYNMETTYGATTLTASVNYNTNEFDSDPSEFLMLKINLILKMVRLKFEECCHSNTAMKIGCSSVA